MSVAVFTNKPEGAEQRFSQYVAGEIKAGRFVETLVWFGRERPGLGSPNRDALMKGQEEEFDQTFCLTVLSRWFGRKRIVKLERGFDDIENLLEPAEHDLLLEAWDIGHQTLREREAAAKEQAETKRQRGAWWP